MTTDVGEGPETVPLDGEADGGRLEADFDSDVAGARWRGELTGLRSE